LGDAKEMLSVPQNAISFLLLLLGHWRVFSQQMLLCSKTSALRI
jgi:hypothetical protein